MSILRHFLFFTLEGNLEFHSLKDSFFMHEGGLFKLDVIDNELHFLRARAAQFDIEYQKDEVQFDNVKSKNLKYKRAIASAKMIEKFNNFYICTVLDDSHNDGLAFSEYERLKATLCYGLKAGEFSIDTALALRIYLFFLSIQNRCDEIKRLLELFCDAFCDDIAQKLINSAEFFNDLSCIILDNCGFYTSELATKSFANTLAKKLRAAALKARKNSDDKQDLLILLEFLEFFKLHKRLDFKEKLAKNKGIKKTARKISKITRSYYLGKSCKNKKK